MQLENDLAQADFRWGLQRKLASALREAAWRAREKGLHFTTLPEFVVEVPREKAHGDFATNLAFLLAAKEKRPAREAAQLILAHLNLLGTWVEKVEVAGPGFINFYLDPAWLYEVLPLVEARDAYYGYVPLEKGTKVQVEFVSANPTGLLHMGNARGAALGDSIANLLIATGHSVTREFYVNDTGNQIEQFTRSLEAHYLRLWGQEVSFPEEGYYGLDLKETVERFAAQEGNCYLYADAAAREKALCRYALAEKLAQIKADLAAFGVNYDVWFFESELHRSGAVKEVTRALDEKGYVYQKEGALWFRDTAFGGEKDEVLVRASGAPTYFAADIAYHKNKFDRGFKRVINVWGADHHGHVSRLRHALAALGYDPDCLTVVLIQLVRLFQNGELLRMSKRTGQYITLGELLEEIGKDAARFFFVLRGADSHLDFDLDLAKSQSAENPVYYVQYAHARICSIIRQAKARGFELPRAQEVELRLLHTEDELRLIEKIADLPQVVVGAAQALEPHRLSYYAQELADLFHSFYTNCRVLTDDPELRKARLVLVNATRIVLRNTLNLLGVQAPERM